MSVTKEITRLEKSNVKLSLTVPKEDVQAQYQDLLKDYAKHAQLPGFRKGKTPQEVLLRKFGDALKGEALSRIIEKAIGEIFDDEKLPVDERPLPYCRPRMEDEPKLDFEQDMKFSLIYDVMPKVNVEKWKGLEVEVPEVTIGEEDIARELEDVRERNSFVLDRNEGDQAQKGDVVTVNYCELGEDGKELPDSRRDDFTFTLGTGYNAYDIDDDIAGMKKGETKEVSKTYPEGEESPLAGRTIKLQITLTALKEKKLPNLDDELAQDVDEKFNTLEDLKKNIRERLEKNLENRIKDAKINKLIEKITENTPVILPESMIEAEVGGRIRNLARRMGGDIDSVMQMLSRPGEENNNMERQIRFAAEKSLHSRLIVETLLKEQNIETGDAEAKEEIAKIASDAGTSLEEVEKYYDNADAMENLKDSICERKLFDLLLMENAVKKGSKMNYLDFLGKNG